MSLALQGGAIRMKHLWEHLGSRPIGALAELVSFGLVAKWHLSRSHVYVALDPAHPAAKSLERLLVRIGALYDFKAPTYHADNELGGYPPVRRSRRRDVRLTFGFRHRTLPLLVLYILGTANASDVARCVPGLERHSARDTFWMFKAFGILEYVRSVSGRSRGFSFRLNPQHPFHEELKAVLSELDIAMPQWRIVAERQSLSSRRPQHEVRAGRRKPKRWKW